MRDFNSGNINGDVTIMDNSNNHYAKLLIHCNNEELIQEEQHRKNILKIERKRKSSFSLKILILSGILILFTTALYWINGSLDIITLLSGVGSFVTFIAFVSTDKPTEFELRQLGALQEINTLLRERGVR